MEQFDRAILLTALLCLVGIGLPGSPTTAKAQTTTGTIIGTVYDQAGAPLAGVKITAINDATGETRTGLTTADGSYRIPLIPPGHYSIRASFAGLADGLTSIDVPLNAKVTFVPPITLAPQTATPAAGGVAGAAGGTPAAGATNLVGIEDATRRGNFDLRTASALPIAGFRSFDRLALLLPGVAPAPQTSGSAGPGVGPGVGTSGQFSVNGQRARANNFTIDGSDNNDQDIGVRRQGFLVTTAQPFDTVQEFHIATLLADAEAGRNTGGQANLVTQSGANTFHGQVFGLLTDSALNARDFFDYSETLVGPLRDETPNPPESPYTRYQLGATAGGAILQNRWHIFGGFERLALHTTRELHFATPTLAERNAAIQLGDGINFLGSDVLFPGFYPLPNNPGGPYGSNTFTQLLEASGDGWLANVRTDIQTPIFSRQSTVSVRYNFTDDDADIPAVDDAIRASLRARTRTHNIAGTIDTQTGERTANQVRLSFGRTRLAFDEQPGSPFIFTSLFGLTGPVGRILYSPYSALGVDPFTFPQSRANNTYQVADTFVMTRGNHALKFGGDIRRVQLNSALDRNYRAQVAFTSGLLLDVGAVSIAPGATFAGLGVPSDLQQSLAVEPNSSLALRFLETNLFIHDAWRVRPNLTLTLGLRYELNTVPTDATGRLEDELRIASTGDFPGNPSDPADQEFFDVLGAQQRVLGQRDQIYEADRNNFAPRVGIAWDIGGKGRATIRAGYGVYYDPILGTVVNQSRNIFPSFIPVNFIGAQRFRGSLAINPAQLFGVPLVVPGTNQLNVPLNDVAHTLGGLFLVDTLALSFTEPANEFRTPYTQQFGITGEASFADDYVASIAYVGTIGRKLIRFRTPNGGPITAATFFFPTSSVLARFPQQARPEPLLGAYTVIESSANSSYHALQATLARRFSRGLGFELAYTWSHAIDDVSDIFDLPGAPVQAQDEIGRDGGVGLDRASAGYDARHRFTANWVYDLPFGGDSFWLGGFQTSGIVTLQTGQPYTVTSSYDANADGNLTDRLNTLNGLTFLDDGRVRIIRDPSVPIASFLAPILNAADSVNGSIGRNTFRAQGIASVDAALTKRFAFSDAQSLIVRFEAFNLFNRPNFAIPVRVLESPGFGSSIATSAPGRVIQFSLRYSF